MKNRSNEICTNEIRIRQESPVDILSKSRENAGKAEIFFRNYFTPSCRRHPIEEPQIAEENCNDDEVTLFLFGHCTMSVFAN